MSMRSKRIYVAGASLWIGLCGFLAWFAVREWSAQHSLLAGSARLAKFDAAQQDGADLIYFYSPGCDQCLATTPAILRASREQPALRIAIWNTATTDLTAIRQRLNHELGVPAAHAFSVPALFSRRRALIGSNEILNNLQLEISRLRTRAHQ